MEPKPVKSEIERRVDDLEKTREKNARARDNEIRKTADRRQRLWRAEEASKDPNLAFMANELMQCTLPHSNPGKVDVWKRTNNHIVLRVESGRHPLTDEFYGIPYGIIPRLILYYINTQAVKLPEGERTISFGKNLRTFMEKIGLNRDTGGGERGDYRRMIEQCTRLFNAHITFIDVKDKEREMPPRMDMLVARKQDLWWSVRNAEHDTIWESTIELSEDFFQAITANPVPVRLEALKVLKRSPLALDLYGWATYRTYLVNLDRKPVRIPLSALKKQFGAEYADTPEGQWEFNRKFKQALAKVKTVYPDLDYEIHDGAVTIKPAPTAVPNRERPALG